MKWLFFVLLFSGVASAGTITTTYSVGGGTITIIGAMAGNISPYVLVNSTYTTLATDSVIDCSTTTSFTVNLITAVGNTGLSYTIMNSSGVITVAPTGGQKINGLTTYVMRNYFESINIFSDNVNWKIR